DWALLARAFRSSKLDWSEAQKSAVAGLATWRMVEKYFGDFASEPEVPFVDPGNCDPASIPKSVAYDVVSNPDGVRCDIYTNEVNVLGRNPQTKLAWRPLDNVGVQYGLEALNDGKIDTEQFLELNEQIGGYDEQGRFTPARMEAAPDAARAAYERGFVMTGGGGLG